MGGIIGGIAGDYLGGIVYDQLFGDLEKKKVKEIELNQFNKGGTIGSEKDNRDLAL